MSSNPFFSVIIPTYNRGEFILKSVKSVIDQELKDFELIIVDDGSTDNTKEILKEYIIDNVSYYYINNSERAAARNYGMAKSTGRYITFLDSDDIYYPNYLSNAYKQLKLLKFPPFYHQAYEIVSKRRKVHYIPKPKSHDLRKELARGNFMSCLGIFILNDITQEHKFNEDRRLSGSEDWEYWIRLIAHFGLKHNNTICAALIIHEDRSVLNITEDSLVARKNLAIQNAFADNMVKVKFKKYRKMISAYWDTYIAQHLILSGQNLKGLKYFFNAFRIYPPSWFYVRTLTIVKSLFDNQIKGKNTNS